MAKIILTNGVINVEENCERVMEMLYYHSSWLELTEIDTTKRHFDKATGVEGDYRVFINSDLIQCVKP